MSDGYLTTDARLADTRLVTHLNQTLSAYDFNY